MHWKKNSLVNKQCREAGFPHGEGRNWRHGSQVRDLHVRLGTRKQQEEDVKKVLQNGHRQDFLEMNPAAQKTVPGTD